MVAQEHVTGLTEVTVLVRRGGRVVPVAMRLDGAKGRWELVEVQILTVRPGLAQAPVQEACQAAARAGRAGDGKGRARGTPG